MYKLFKLGYFNKIFITKIKLQFSFVEKWFQYDRNSRLIKKSYNNIRKNRSRTRP